MPAAGKERRRSAPACSPAGRGQFRDAATDCGRLTFRVDRFHYKLLVDDGHAHPDTKKTDVDEHLQ